MQLCTVSVVVSMDAELEETRVDDVDQCEERIVSQSRAVLPAGSQHQIQSEVDEILGRFGLQTRLLVVERVNSLILYFICMTLSALMSLRDQWCSQQLRDIVQSLFTFLLDATVFEGVFVKRLTWLLSDYQRCLKFFDSVQGK